jgi:hypothetical protein
VGLACRTNPGLWRNQISSNDAGYPLHRHQHREHAIGALVDILLMYAKEFRDPT